MIGRLNHVAIAVPDLAIAARRYRALFGADVGPEKPMPEHGVTIVFVTLENGLVELMAPLGADSPLAGFLARSPGGGMHHICFEVPDMGTAMETLIEGGARVLGPVRRGAHGLPVVFLHPKDFDGTLIELEEHKPELQPA